MTHGWEEDQDPRDSREGREMEQGFQEIPQPRKELAKAARGRQAQDYVSTYSPYTAYSRPINFTLSIFLGMSPRLFG